MSFSLKELHQTYPDLDIHWRSYELRPAGAPPMPPWYLARIENESRPRFIQMMKQAYNIDIHSGPFGILSRKALIGAKYAEKTLPDGGMSYHDAVLRAYWQEGKDISDDAALRQIAVSVGMDADAFAAALTDPALDADVSADVTQADIYGLTGVPALIFNGRFLLAGAQPVEVLRHVIERLNADGGESLKEG